MTRKILHIIIISIIAFLFGCATTVEEDLPAAEDDDEAVLTIPDAYDAISLAVQVGDPEAAIAAYEEAQLEDPDNPEAQVLLANLYLVAGQIEEAEAILTSVLEEDPSNADALYLQSLLFGVRGQRDEQKALLERIVQERPENAQAQAALGELYLEDRNYRAAEQALRAAVSADEQNLVARVGLGNLYLRRERWEDAEEQLTAAIEIDSEYSFAYADRARARTQQYELSAADRDLTAALSLDPDYYWHYIDRGRVRLEQRRYELAATDFERAVAIDDARFIGHLLFARATDANGEYEAALPLYERALSIRPDYAPAYPQIAVIYYMFEQFDQAERYFEAAHEDQSSIYEYALLAALAMKQADRNEEARRYLLGLVNFLPRDSIMYHMMRYYIDPRSESLVLTILRDERDKITQARMYFYLGEQMHILDRKRTAEASFSRAEAELQPGFVEQRLAAWRLRSYGSE
ncbi:MAG: tetratricopeptide repeat protein [Spirochaetales bacterium]